MRGQSSAKLSTSPRLSTKSSARRRSRLEQSLLLALALCLLAPATAAHAAGTSAATSSFIRADACIEHQAFLDGDPAAVAARLPGGYTATTDPASGRPMLFARAEHCQITVGATTVPATMAVFGIVVDSPDGRGCASGAPGVGESVGQLPPVCNWYPIEWLASDQRVVNWLRTDSPGPLAVLVPGMRFQLGSADSTGAIPFHFSAPAPAPSPFSMDDAGHPGSATVSVRGGYWFGSGTGAEKIAFSTDDITPGQASGDVAVTPGSEAAKLLGSPHGSYLPQYTEIGGEHWGHGSYRRQLLGPAPNTDTFSGACSLAGVDTFDPPATNTAQDLHVAYDAKGTCSGILDGRQINDTPVGWHSEAHSYGSCSQANTVEPGLASLTFPSGAEIQSTFDFSTALTQVNMSFYGVRSGFASGQATFLTPQTGPDAVTNCAGSGDRQVPMDLSISTDSPLVSPSNQTTSPSAGNRSAHTLHLSVAPRTIPAGDTTTLRFVVTTAHRRPEPRAVISFHGRRARTNSRGSVTMRVRLREPGRQVAVARKPGFRPGRITINAVRRRG